MPAPAVIPLLLRLLPLLTGFGTSVLTSKGIGALSGNPAFAGKFPRLASSLVNPKGLLPGALNLLGFMGGAEATAALLGQGEPPRDDTAGFNNLLAQLRQPAPMPENDEAMIRLLQQFHLQGRVPELLEQSGVV